MNPWTPLPKIFAGFLRRDCNESHQSHLLPDGTGRTPGRPAGASLLEPEIFRSCAELGPVFAKKSIQRVLVVTDEGILRSGIDFSMPILLGYSGLSDALLKKYIADSAPLWKNGVESLRYTSIGSVVGTHAGPGAIAAAFFRK